MDLVVEDLKKYGLYQPSFKNNEIQLASRPCSDILFPLVLSLQDNTEINIFIPEENHLSDGEISKELVSLIKEKNIKINFIFGGFRKYEVTEKYDSPENNLHLHLWPTGGIFDAVQSIIPVYPPSELLNRQEDEIKYLFVSLTNKAKLHRCYLIDNLVKNDILRLGTYTWHNSYYDSTYKWKYADPVKLQKQLEDNYSSRQFPKYSHLPKDYFHSFMHLISEGLDDGDYITEKTVIPLLHKKPFIVQSTKGFHSILRKKLKFELYDEIFDYEFDQIDNWIKRTDLIIQNITNLKKQDFKKIKEKLKPKLEYNQNRVFEIIREKIFVPEIVLKSKIMNERYYLLKSNI